MKQLDANKPQEVVYCIPNWLRDEQVRVNTASIRGRVEQGQALRDEPIAIVCFGPSLVQTWEEVKKFKHVMTCSGAHKFLIDRGIIPTHHVEVDPREHKVKLIGEPHKDVDYLIASTCHPKYFGHIASFRDALTTPGKGGLKLWHVFSDEEEARRVLPPNEWALTGGCGAGLRAMTIARFLGFREQHIFGMDGSEGETGKHAAEHPSQAKGCSTTEWAGKTYRTTPAFLEAARGTFHELNQMSDVAAKFYGEGLVQAMAKDYVRVVAPGLKAIAFAKPELMSPTYRELNEKLHRENLAFGVGGGRHAKTVMELVEKLKTRSVLDYGCGKGYLAKAIPFPIWEYDPAIPEKSASPRPADLVVCTDVLEHVEEDKIKFVLSDLARCVKQVGFFVIHTGPSKKTLADGRNAHILQRDKPWWTAKLKKFFAFQAGSVKVVGHELFVVVGPKEK